jgi:protein-S-isoprenylcysteine O-methyltransferase Ste14
MPLSAIVRKTAHGILAESYLVYIVLLVPAVVASAFFAPSAQLLRLVPVGVFLLVVSPLLIMWAQQASGNFKNEKNAENLTLKVFMKGPYRYMRFPTHLGLFLLVSGLAFVTGSFIIFVAGLVATIICHQFFLPIEDKVLSLKYGEPYKAYKQAVRIKI